MSDNIDYDELDKAVTEAIKARSSKKATAPKPAAKHVAPKTQKAPAKTVAPQPVAVRRQAPVASPAPKPKTAHHYMDFVRRPAAAPRQVVTAAPAAVAPKAPRLIPNAAVQRPAAPVMQRAATPVAKKPTARLVATKTTTASMPQYRTATRVVTQKPAAVAAKPAARPAAAPALTPVKRTETPTAVIEKAPQPAAPKVKPEAAPNADNYSIGGRSPFLTDTKVEKTPLGKNSQQSSASSIESTKNTYSQKSPTRSKAKAEKKHVVTEDPKGKSGWLWTIIALLVIAAGGGLGYLAYLIGFAK